MFNRVRYSNAELDATLTKGMEEFDTKKRVADLEQVTRMVFAGTSIVPLYWRKVYWAAKKGLTFEGGLSESTPSQDVSTIK